LAQAVWFQSRPHTAIEISAQELRKCFACRLPPPLEMMFAFRVCLFATAVVGAFGGCVAQTGLEAMVSLREKAKCTNPATVPTGCKCTANKEPQVTCNAANKATWDGSAGGTAKTWAAADAKCIKVTPDKQQDWTKHDYHYPANYANTCEQAGMEPGSYHCTWIKNKTHTWGGAGYNSKWDSEDWCTDKFCWVDPCACDKIDISKSSWLNGYYSYSLCGQADQYTPVACSANTDKTVCTGTAGCKWTDSVASGASGIKIGIMSALFLLSFAK